MPHYEAISTNDRSTIKPQFKISFISSRAKERTVRGDCSDSVSKGSFSRGSFSRGSFSFGELESFRELEKQISVARRRGDVVSELEGLETKTVMLGCVSKFEYKRICELRNVKKECLAGLNNVHSIIEDLESSSLDFSSMLKSLYEMETEYLAMLGMRVPNPRVAELQGRRY